MVSGMSDKVEENAYVAPLGPLVVEYMGAQVAVPRNGNYQETLSLIKLSVMNLSLIPTSLFVLSTTTLPDHLGENVVVNEPVWQTIVFSAYFSSISVRLATAMRREYPPSPLEDNTSQGGWDFVREPGPGRTPNPFETTHSSEDWPEAEDPGRLFNIGVFGMPKFGLLNTPCGAAAKAISASILAAVNYARSKIDVVRRALMAMTREQDIFAAKAFLVVIWVAYSSLCIAEKELGFYESWQFSILHRTRQELLRYHLLQGILCLVGNVGASVLILFVLQSWFLRAAVIAQVAFNWTLMY